MTEIGLCSTPDELYYAAGAFDLPGARLFTASHNPAKYNVHQACAGRARPCRPGHRSRRDPPTRRILAGFGRAPRSPGPTGTITATGHVGGLRGAPPRPRRPDRASAP
ncbi:hypothetical protein ACRAWF_08620 [Streptomyces sp. L7]